MTRYPADLDHWEFKIVRSSYGAFGDQQKREQILAKEAEAQWELVEVFDNARIRLRRPRKAKDFDSKLDFDPYRTHVDLPIKINVTTLLVFGIVLTMIGGVFLVAAIIENL